MPVPRQASTSASASVATVEHGVPPMQPKVGPTPWAHQEGKQDNESRQEMGHPISSRIWTRKCQDPGRGVGGLRVQPLPGASLQTRWLLGSVVLQAAGLPPGASSILKRIRTPTRALGARRLGLQEEGQSLGLGRWGCQRTTSSFPKG